MKHFFRLVLATMIFSSFRTAHAQTFEGYQHSGWWAGIVGTAGRDGGGGSVVYSVGRSMGACPPCPVPVGGYITLTNAETGTVTTNNFFAARVSRVAFRAHIEGGGLIVGRGYAPNGFNSGGRIIVKVGRRYVRGIWYAGQTGVN